MKKRTLIPWTAKEIDLLKQHYCKDMSSVQIAEILGRPVQNVRQKAYKMRLTKRKPIARKEPVWERKDIIDDHTRFTDLWMFGAKGCPVAE